MHLGHLHYLAQMFGLHGNLKQINVGICKSLHIQYTL